MSTPSSSIAAASDREIVSTRLFDAPRELVFQAYSEGERLARWWGPKGFTNTFTEFALKPGADWRFTMHGPNGTDYPNHSVFDEVSAEKIVFRHFAPNFQMTILLAEEAGKTRMTWRMLFETAELCENLRAICVPSNEENFDRLAAELADMANRDLIFTRIIDAPREKVFRCWTEPALLTQWFTLATWVTVRAEIDVRPGGTSLLTMRGPDGAEMANRDTYLEVVKNERLVLTDAYTSAWEPSERPFMTVILSFEDEGGKTRYTVRIRHWSAADREAHEKMGFHQNWSVSTDQLAALAAKI